MDAIKRFILELFSDESGNKSMKRLISLVCVLCLCFLLLKNPDSHIIDAMVVIVCVAMGATTIDKFSKIKRIDNEDKN